MTGRPVRGLLEAWRTPPGQWFLNFSASGSPGRLVNLLGPSTQLLIREVWGGAGECAFLTVSQVVLILLLQGPHFENHSSEARQWDGEEKMDWEVFWRQGEGDLATG